MEDSAESLYTDSQLKAWFVAVREPGEQKLLSNSMLCNSKKDKQAKMRATCILLPCTKSKGALSPFYSLQQSEGLKLVLSWNSRVYDHLVKGVNNFRGCVAMVRREFHHQRASLLQEAWPLAADKGNHINEQVHDQHLRSVKINYDTWKLVWCPVTQTASHTEPDSWVLPTYILRPREPILSPSSWLP